ncbi:MAG: tRNA threonylcarbamoyladenosine biosynthesis protein TsaE [Frankiaceae bacterium]|jgi:tRNA threonylcarbamoyladenosine biosynthesis protein TsaE|nr:tRNA threonylcarbamoyladenosine biosynthesis protein TsaE [Frankiaceae bacterium]MDQ1726557.1 tRNA threonylcarbamoyladenosine biosynthesis protein TsaE [Frankiaceae bacterium]
MNIATPDDMRAFGLTLAGTLRAGDLVLLSGPLGAGKTTLTQGIVAGLGGKGPVVSPTFVIARVYRGGRLPVLHVDAYRIGSIAEIDDLDLDASTDESVTLVEWGNGLVEGLVEDYLEVRITRPIGGEMDAEVEPRTIEVAGYGERWADVELAAANR